MESYNFIICGRLTLTKSILSVLPSYVMQVTNLPLSVCDELDKISRNFVWGEINGQRNVHMVAWRDPCKPKAVGGLGLGSSRVVNQAFMMKIGWNLCANRKVVPKGGSSNLWQGVCKNCAEIQKNIIWRVGKGDRVCFWVDHRIPRIWSLFDF